MAKSKNKTKLVLTEICAVRLKVTDDWYPNLVGNHIEARMTSFDERGYVQLSFWGGDDYGMAKLFPYTNGEDKVSALTTALMELDYCVRHQPINATDLREKGYENQ